MSQKEPNKPHDTFILRVKIKGENFFKIVMTGKHKEKLIAYAENSENRIDSFEILTMDKDTGVII